MKRLNAANMNLRAKNSEQLAGTFAGISAERTTMSINYNMARRNKPALLITLTAALAFLAAVAVPLATAHTTTGLTANPLRSSNLALSSGNMHVKSKAQLLRLAAQSKISNGQTSAPSQIRPDVWAGTVTTVAQAAY
jgi:hypothetical protein